MAQMKNATQRLPKPGELLAAIDRQLQTNLREIDQLPEWKLRRLEDRGIGTPDEREALSGFVRWEPSRWFEMTRTQLNDIVLLIRELARLGLVEVQRTGQRITFVRLTPAGRERQLDDHTTDCAIVQSPNTEDSTNENH